MKKPQMYKGNPPTKPGWYQAGRIMAGGVGWLVFVRPHDGQPNWATVKACALEPVPGKANYWTQVSFDSRRLRHTGELFDMRERYPDKEAKLLAMVCDGEGRA